MWSNLIIVRWVFADSFWIQVLAAMEAYLEVGVRRFDAWLCSTNQNGHLSSSEWSIAWISFPYYRHVAKPCIGVTRRLVPNQLVEKGIILSDKGSIERWDRPCTNNVVLLDNIGARWIFAWAGSSSDEWSEYWYQGYPIVLKLSFRMEILSDRWLVSIWLIYLVNDWC